MTLTMDFVEVDPATAEQWLKTMAVNRNISRPNLEGICDAMLEGHWHDDGTPIRFNAQGQLVDGQHRLTAVTITEKTIKFLVIWNVQDAAMTTLDTGKTRSRSDVLKIHNPSVTDVHRLAAVSTMIQRWEKGVRGNNLRNEYLSNDAFIRFFDENSEALTAALLTGRRVYHHVGGTTAQAMGLCAYLFAQVDETGEDATYFWERFIDGVGLEAGSPILALRRYFAGVAARQKESVRSDIQAATVIKAWNAYRQGRTITVLSFKVGGANPDRFPEPV